MKLRFGSGRTMLPIIYLRHCPASSIVMPVIRWGKDMPFLPDNFSKISLSNRAFSILAVTLPHLICSYPYIDIVLPAIDGIKFKIRIKGQNWLILVENQAFHWKFGLFWNWLHSTLLRACPELDEGTSLFFKIVLRQTCSFRIHSTSLRTSLGLSPMDSAVRRACRYLRRASDFRPKAGVWLCFFKLSTNKHEWPLSNLSGSSFLSDWLCFFAASKRQNLHNPLLSKMLSPF